MSRTDQYIGLNKNAVDFLDRICSYKNKYTNNGYTKYHIVDVVKNSCILVPMEDTLCHSYDLFGSKTTVHINDSLTKLICFTETIQVTPWSSGPMYFTHLKYDIYRNEKGEGDPYYSTFLYSWSYGLHIDISSMDNNPEFDQEKGIIYNF